jgi:hypothetical protein
MPCDFEDPKEKDECILFYVKPMAINAFVDELIFVTMSLRLLGKKRNV